MTRAMDDIRKGIPYIPSDPGFYREDGPVDWLRTQEGVWLHSTFPSNSCWTLDASRMGPRPFMVGLEPIGFGDLRQYGRVPDGDAGFWFDDRGPILWLRTIEGVWLAADPGGAVLVDVGREQHARRGHGPPACRHTGRGPDAA